MSGRSLNTPESSKASSLNERLFLAVTAEISDVAKIWLQAGPGGVLGTPFPSKGLGVLDYNVGRI